MGFRKKMRLMAMLMCMVLVGSGCSSATAGNGEQTLDIDYVGADGEVVTETVSQENGGMTGWLKEKLSTDGQDADTASNSGSGTVENTGEASGLQDVYSQGSSKGGSSAGGSVSSESGKDSSSSSGNNGDGASSGNNGNGGGASGGDSGSSVNNGENSSSGGNDGSGGGSSSGSNGGNGGGSSSGSNGGNGGGSSSGSNDGSGGGSSSGSNGGGSSEGSTTSKNTVTLTIRCDTAVANGMHEESKWAGIVPANGCILPVTTLEFTDGETVFNLLCRVRDTYKLQMEYSGTDATAYIQGINNLYEKDAGKWSGWMYNVNGWYPNYGCGQYVVENGDVIEWRYTCDGGADLGNAMVP